MNTTPNGVAMKDLISVYIPTKDRPDLLARALDSIVKQTYQNIEVIICDDGSSYDVKELASKVFKNSNINYKVIVNEKSIGACASRNIAIRNASGKFITGLDDDDEFHTSRIDELIKNYSSEYSFIATNMLKKGTDTPVFKQDLICTKDLIMWANVIGNQIFVEKSRVIDVGGYDEKLTSCQDHDLWLRLIDRYGKAKRLNSCLYYLNVDHGEERITTSPKKIQGMESFLVKHKHDMSRRQQDFYKIRIQKWKSKNLGSDNKFEFKRLLSLINGCFIKYWVAR